uniref:Putative GATA transcription factor 5 n=1 Tax=Davidia involucrata TaxID=16924 RepID=A0A5B7AGR6_DAVIN
MLYRTHHHPFFFPFNPFIPFPPPTTSTPLHPLSSPPPPPIQVEQGMECVEGALKSSFGPEMAVKTTQQAFLDDVLTVNAQSGVSGDDFFVDDLLDFSKGGIEDDFFEEEQEHDEEDNKPCCVSVFPQEQDHQAEKDNNSVSDPSRSSFYVKSDFGSELSVPADDLADLEWLSHFVEDSFSEYSLTFPAGKLSEKPTENRSESEIPVSTKPCFTTPVQTKARSKRARTGGRVWLLGSPSLTESSTSSSSSSSSTSSSAPSNPWLIYTGPSQTAESFLGKPPAKKQKKKPATEASAGGPQQARRCSHCLVQKTPQWRTGPLGAKTLCNACGVRYKSGRLLPEYRPACSPTFSSEVHSNNHRKVLEMRRKKELAPGSLSPVQSF